MTQRIPIVLINGRLSQLPNGDSTTGAPKDLTDGVAGLTGFKLNLKNVAGTVLSWFTTTATAARTWTMPDKDGTVAMTSDISAAAGDTDAIAEGSVHLYFTSARARAALSASGSLSYNSSTGVFSFTDAVSSVAGKTGAVTLVKGDVGLGNVDNTSDATKNSATATLTNKTLTAPLISQIVFPATQVPSSDPNTLDDYEEGTWDAIVTTDGVDFTSVTYQFQRCKYIKIGRLVFVYGLIRTTACTIGSATGTIKVAGLPFTSAPTDVGYYRASISCTTAAVNTTFQFQAMQLEPNSNYMYPFLLNGNVIAASSMGTGSNGFNAVIGGCYMTA